MLSQVANAESLRHAGDDRGRTIAVPCPQVGQAFNDSDPHSEVVFPFHPSTHDVRADAADRGLSEGDRVVVRSETGEMEASVAIVDIRAGNLAMYYPEANILVPGRIDARSKTPAFKSIAARIEPISSHEESREDVSR